MDIKEPTFTALRVAYHEGQIFKLNFEGQIFSLPEYFITVNMCKELLKWSMKNRKYYKIEAEKRTSELFDGCFDSSRLEIEGNIFSKMLFASSAPAYNVFKEEIRKGKVDIALTSEGSGFDNITEAIIEIKAINPSTTKLLADFCRISCFLKAKISGFQNHMKYGYLSFIKHENSIKKIQTDEQFEQLKNKYIKRLENNINRVCPDKITFKVFESKINKYSYSDLIGNMDEDFSENAYRTFMAYSVIIEIFKNSQETTKP